MNIKTTLTDEQVHEEEINQAFESLLADMTDDEFWQWIATWKDQGELIDETKSWDTETKEQTIKELTK